MVFIFVFETEDDKKGDNLKAWNKKVCLVFISNFSKVKNDFFFARIRTFDLIKKKKTKFDKMSILFF